MSHPLSLLRHTSFLFTTSSAAIATIGALSAIVWTMAETVGIGEAQAAPRPSRAVAKTAAASNLTFNLTARFSYRDAEESSPDPEQVVNAKFALSGRRIRIESELAGRPLVVIVNPPYAYRLLPSSKSGVRYRASSLPNWSRQVLGSNDLLPDPTAIRAGLARAGARRAGTAQINGVVTDVYTATSFRGQKGSVKAWLRRSDALPVRFELKSNKLSAVASWRNYQRGRALPVSLFTVPTGYRVREGSQAAG